MQIIIRIDWFSAQMAGSEKMALRTGCLQPNTLLIDKCLKVMELLQLLLFTNPELRRQKHVLLMITKSLEQTWLSKVTIGGMLNCRYWYCQ